MVSEVHFDFYNQDGKGLADLQSCPDITSAWQLKLLRKICLVDVHGMHVSCKPL